MTESAITRRLAAALALGAPLSFGQLAKATPASEILPPSRPAGATDGGEDATTANTAGNRLSHITAEVMVNGQGPFNFLVDTGANRSAVSERLVERLGLPIGPPLRVMTVVGARDRPTVQLEELRIGTRTQRDVQAPILMLTGGFYDGVLGVDWLANRRLTFFFDDARLEITGSNAIVDIDDRIVKRMPVIVPARLRTGQLTIVDAQLGRRVITTMIDTGAQLTLGNNALRRALERQGRAQRARPITFSTVTGERKQGDVLLAPALRVGGIMFGDLPVVFAELPMFATWGMEDQPALVLGLDVLSEFSAITLDFGRRQVRFQVAEPSASQRSRQADRRATRAPRGES